MALEPFGSAEDAIAVVLRRHARVAAEQADRARNVAPAIPTTYAGGTRTGR